MSINQEQKNLQGLQILRAIAAALVVFHHIGQSTERALIFLPNWLCLAVESGAFGVDIFFVLSGFIMIYTLRDKGSRPVLFLVKRIIRIYPLYWIASLFIIVLSFTPWLFKSVKLDFGRLFYSLTLVPCVNQERVVHPLLDQGWTLSFEMYFYLILTVLMLISYKRLVIATIVFMYMAVIVLLRMVFGEHSIQLQQFYGSPVILEFAMGGLVGVLFSKKGWSISKRSAAYVILVFLCGGIVGFALCKNESLRFVYWGGPSMGLVAVFAGLRKETTWYWSKLYYLGNASYSTYLFHAFVVMCFGILVRLVNVNIGFVIVLAFGTFFASHVLGVLVYELFEKKLISGAQLLLKRFDG